MRQTRAQAIKATNVSTSANATAIPLKTSPITLLLSQYELLRLLCEHLSSADIIHLGATCKKHWRYIASSKKVQKELIGKSSCDGRGIIAQARVFGYWKGNPDNATRKCKGKDAEPCEDCGAMVCNICRFHIRYPTWGPYSENVESWDAMEGQNEEEIEDVWHDCELRLDDWTGDCEVPKRGEIELMKACDIFYTARIVEYCNECQPLFTEFDWMSDKVCNCCLFGHFVSRWRCIPCVLVEETKSIARAPKYTYRHFTELGFYFTRRLLCGCGRPASPDGIMTCKICRLPMMTDEFTVDLEDMMRRIYVQLGTSMDDRNDDPDEGVPAYDVSLPCLIFYLALLPSNTWLRLSRLHNVAMSVCNLPLKKVFESHLPPLTSHISQILTEPAARLSIHTARLINIHVASILIARDPPSASPSRSQINMLILSDLLARYDILITICKNLSFVDGFHLASTCREIWTIFAKGKSHQPCPERSALRCRSDGILYQAQEFGMHHDYPTNLDWQCAVDVGAQPCTDCGIVVCNYCRFHTFYPYPPQELGNDITHARDRWFNSERENFDLFERVIMSQTGVNSYLTLDPESRSEDEEYELAWLIFYKNRLKFNCRDCEPLVLVSPENSCKCEFLQHFLSPRWVCIPCVFQELDYYKKIPDGKLAKQPDGDLVSSSRFPVEFALRVERIIR
ncbi:hypothetical protein Q7P37_001228 [Cladosporium fusiforme]